MTFCFLCLNCLNSALSFNMKKTNITKAGEWKMRKEYDFSDSRPNKYAEKYAEGVTIVILKKKKDSYGMTAPQLISKSKKEELQSEPHHPLPRHSQPPAGGKF